MGIQHEGISFYPLRDTGLKPLDLLLCHIHSLPETSNFSLHLLFTDQFSVKNLGPGSVQMIRLTNDDTR